MFEMKDSGIEWLGEIPSHWNLTKISTVYDERNTKVSDKEFMPLSVTKKGILPQLETAAKTDNGDNRKLILKGDFVINSRSDRRGSCGISSYNGSCSLINTVLIPRQKMCNEFYNFVFKTERFAEEFYRWGHGIVDDLWSTKWSDMKNIYIPLPPLDEQKKIADFLDKKCSAIDSALDAAKKLVEKFREYKKSLITETVTKGLNPSAEFVDSNIEWLDEIPSHWKIIKLKFLAIQKNSILSDGDWIESKDLSVDGINYFTTGNVGDGFFKENDFNYVSNETFDTLNCTAIKGGDFIFSRLNLPMGRACIIPDKYIKSVIAVDNVLFRPDDYVEKNFILYVTMCPHYQEHNALVARGTTMQRMSHSQLKNLKIPIPPLAEQKKIADFLDKKCSVIDEKISKREKLIEKLTEYKKSLIYEVVTGKLEV